MPRISTKHPEREKTFAYNGFPGGYNKEQSDTVIPASQLSRCRNLRYNKSLDAAGNEIVSVSIRRGTTVITSEALPSSAYPVAATYYKNQSQYVIAGSDSNLYYLDSSDEPQLIGALDSTTVKFTEFNQLLIIHDTGITKYWDGTTFAKLDCRYEDEVIGTGNNVTTEFTATLTNLPVEPSSCTITFTDATAKSLTDNGTGAFTGDLDADWIKTITGCADNGGGLIQVTSNGHGFANDDLVSIYGVVGTTEANNTASNPTWVVANQAVNTFDLAGSTFTNAYTSGGTANKNTIIYSTGVVNFQCDGAPDDSTSLYAMYDDDEGGPKSKDGIVRASRLYMWGDSDNTSRLWYSAVSDQEAWDSSSDGGYLDCDPDDGYALISVLNFFQSLLLLKDNSMHRVDNFPGDTVFQVEPLLDKELGCIAYRSALNEGNVISFCSGSGWEAMSPSDRYGDIQKLLPLSNRFKSEYVQFINSSAVTAYNQLDKELWLNLYDSDNSEYLSHIHVVNLETGGQLSEYVFAFTHSCFAFANDEMLIGGSDGHLYKLDNTNYVFDDNGTSFASDTYLRTSFSEHDYYHLKKLLKEIYIRCSAKSGGTATLNIYTDRRYGVQKTYSVALPVGDVYINPDGDYIYIYDMQSYPIAPGSGSTGNFNFYPRLHWKNIMLELTSIDGSQGFEIFGANLKCALIGDF